MFRVILNERPTKQKLEAWRPKWEEFDGLVVELVDRFMSMPAAHDMLAVGNEVLAHSQFFMRDAMLFEVFSDAIRNADVGVMHLVYTFWLFMMRGSNCHNYGSELLEMRSQFLHEFSAERAAIVERTWLVNRWGKKGRSVATDHYLEVNNNFTKVRISYNM